MTGWWERLVVPRVVDYSLKGKEIGELRDEVCADLSGCVLEIGFGGGLNIRSYPAAVTQVDAVEPSDLGWDLSARRRRKGSVAINRIGLDGQGIDVPDNTYDAVLCTFTLCTIPDAPLALQEMSRALKPGGTLHLLEHGRSRSERAQRWQDRLNPIQRRVAGGCNLNRDMHALTTTAGFDPLQTRELSLPGVPGPTGKLMHAYLGVWKSPA